MLDLSKRGGHRVKVAWPAGAEYQHGADIGLWVVVEGFRVGFRLQAKAPNGFETVEELGCEFLFRWDRASSDRGYDVVPAGAAVLRSSGC
jgi:hypothetical protein